MAQRLMKLSELLALEAHLPVKQELQGRRVLMYKTDQGQPATKLVSDAAWNLDCVTLVNSSDATQVVELQTIIDDNAFWVVFPTVKEVTKPKVISGYGLGYSVEPEEAPSSNFSSPGVPEPWMGTYGDNQPVIPCSQSPASNVSANEYSGLEYNRMQRSAGLEAEYQAASKPAQYQPTISSMFARQPMVVEPMDF